MNARKYPRTMQAAFGPYTDNRLHPMPEPRRRFHQDWTMYVVALLAVMVVIHFWR
jgi:hypothetical protein